MRDKNRSVEFEDELDRPVRNHRHSILQRVVLVVIVLLLVCIGIGGWKVYRGFQPVSSESETVSFTVPEGSTIKSVSEDLAEQGIIDSSQIGYYYAKFEGFSNLIAGTFTLDKSWDLNKIYTTLTDINASTNQSGISVTIIDGDWAKHIAENISSVTNVSYDELIALWNNQEYLRSLMPKYPFLTEEMFQEGVRCYLEGYFAPNTYQFDEDSTAQEITEKRNPNASFRYEMNDKRFRYLIDYDNPCRKQEWKISFLIAQSPVSAFMKKDSTPNSLSVSLIKAFTPKTSLL